MDERSALPSKKRCGHCKRVKDRSNFGFRADRNSLQSWCMPCKNAERRRRRRVGVQLQLDIAVKRCPSCRVYKATDAFAVATARKDGRQSTCRVCMRLRIDSWNVLNPLRMVEGQQRWYRANREKVAARTRRRRAAQLAAITLPFTPQQLAQRWLYYGNRCWICRAEATATDHVKPLTKGGAHMLCNLRPICKHCNSSKHNKWPFSVSMVRCA